MDQSGFGKRREERVSTELPVDLGTAKGITRNVSASGIFFETDVPYEVGGEIDFSVDLETAGGKVVLRCRGRIARVILREGKVGVGVKIIDSKMEAAK